MYWMLVVQLQEDKIRAIQEKLELCEQKLAQYAKLPDMEQELKQRMEALTQVRAQVRLIEIWITTTHRILFFLSDTRSLASFIDRFDNFLFLSGHIVFAGLWSM